MTAGADEGKKRALKAWNEWRYGSSTLQRLWKTAFGTFGASRHHRMRKLAHSWTPLTKALPYLEVQETRALGSDWRIFGKELDARVGDFARVLADRADLFASCLGPFIADFALGCGQHWGLFLTALGPAFPSFCRASREHALLLAQASEAQASLFGRLLATHAPESWDSLSHSISQCFLGFGPSLPKLLSALGPQADTLGAHWLRNQAFTNKVERGISKVDPKLLGKGLARHCQLFFQALGSERWAFLEALSDWSVFLESLGKQSEYIWDGLGKEDLHSAVFVRLIARCGSRAHVFAHSIKGHERSFARALGNDTGPFASALGQGSKAFAEGLQEGARLWAQGCRPHIGAWTEGLGAHIGDFTEGLGPHNEHWARGLSKDSREFARALGPHSESFAKSLGRHSGAFAKGLGSHALCFLEGLAGSSKTFFHALGPHEATFRQNLSRRATNLWRRTIKEFVPLASAQKLGLQRLRCSLCHSPSDNYLELIRCDNCGTMLHGACLFELSRNRCPIDLSPRAAFKPITLEG